MGNTRFSSTISPKTQSSGISNIPKLLKYPKFLNNIQLVKDMYAYIIPHYGYDGLSVLIYRQPKNDNIIIICGDWYGNQLDLIDIPDPDTRIRLASDFLINDAMKLYELLKLIKVEQVQLFFAIDDVGLLLVDMQLTLNKFASPGMLKDIFSNIYRVPEMKAELVDNRILECIDKAAGSFNGNLIIKPNKFKMYEEGGTWQPLYVEVVR